MKKILITLSILCLIVASDKVEQGEQSDLSKLLKSSGSLLVKESHSLPELKTTYGENIECAIFILRNALDESQKEIGLKLSREEKYSTRSAFLDFDELDGLLSSINIIQERGFDLCTKPSIEVPQGSENSTEIDYISKDGLKFGVYVSKEKLNYAIQVSRTADWAFLSENAVEALKTNINTVLKIK